MGHMKLICAECGKVVILPKKQLSCKYEHTQTQRHETHLHFLLQFMDQPPLDKKSQHVESDQQENYFLGRCRPPSFLPAGQVGVVGLAVLCNSTGSHSTWTLRILTETRSGLGDVRNRRIRTAARQKTGRLWRDKRKGRRQKTRDRTQKSVSRVTPGVAGVFDLFRGRKRIIYMLFKVFLVEITLNLNVHQMFLPQQSTVKGSSFGTLNNKNRN